MKKATGAPWSSVIGKGNMERDLAVFERLTDVVAYAHSRGVIHRDIKPKNVLLGEFGEVWLADWGIAVERNAEGDYRHAAQAGTPRYMAPEMARGDSAQLGPASDIYLLGAVLFETFAGRTPTPDDAAAIARESAPEGTVADTEEHSPKSLVAVVGKAMATDPRHRYRSVQAMQQAFRNARKNEAGNEIMTRADDYLETAREEGGYILYQHAIAEYDSAIAAASNTTRANRRRSAAILAYAEEALKNEEFDLARSIIASESGKSKQRAKLLVKIENEQAKAVRFRRRRSIVNSLLGLMVLGLLATGAYLAYYRYDYAADLTQESDTGFGPRLTLLSASLRHASSAANSGVSHAQQAGRTDLRTLYERIAALLAECTDEMRRTAAYTPREARRLHGFIRERMPEMTASMLDAGALADKPGDETAKSIHSYVQNAFASFVNTFGTFMPLLDRKDDEKTWFHNDPLDRRPRRAEQPGATRPIPRTVRGAIPKPDKRIHPHLLQPTPPRRGGGLDPGVFPAVSGAQPS